MSLYTKRYEQLRLEVEKLRSDLTACQLERDRLRAQLTNAVEVIQWKSLYNKAEMGWYADWLVATVEGREPDRTAILGKQWYERVTLRSSEPQGGDPT